MPIQTNELTPQRIGESKGRILSHAMPMHCLNTIGQVDQRERNSGTVTKYRRWLPKGATPSSPNRFFQDGPGDRTLAYANAQLASDGVTRAAETLVPQDISVVQRQFSILMGWTDETENLNEDIIPKAMEEQVGERIGLVNEMYLYGKLKACANKFFGGTGTSRATVNGRISLGMLRRISRSMLENHSKPVTKMLQAILAKGLYNTAPIGGRCFPVFISTDLCSDVRDLPNYIPRENYPDQSKAVPGEVGTCEEFRFIASPELVPIQDSGAAVANTVPPLKSTSGTNADVYQFIVGSQDSWGHLGLKLDSKNISLLPTGQKDKADPQGQRGYVGAIWHYNAVLLNELQMAVGEVGADALTNY